MKFKYQKIPLSGYDPQKPLIARPLIAVYLHSKTNSTMSPLYALLDSGADYVLFPAELAQEVDIKDIMNGRHGEAIGIANQKADVYYFELELEVVGYSKKLSTVVGFSNTIFLPILGRSFFSHFGSVIFNENSEEVELKV